MPSLPENCSICGKKMEKGYVTGDTGIFWSKEKKKISLWGAEVLVGGRVKMTFANAEAYRCPNCKIVLFSYEKK